MVRGISSAVGGSENFSVQHSDVPAHEDPVQSAPARPSFPQKPVPGVLLARLPVPDQPGIAKRAGQNPVRGRTRHIVEVAHENDPSHGRIEFLEKRRENACLPLPRPGLHVVEVRAGEHEFRAVSLGP